MSDVVYTPDGRGKVVEKETRHGRTWINVAGNGFQGWYLSHEVTADIGDNHVVNLDDLPDPDDGARLPWDPEPRDLFHDQLNIQPTSDLPPNLNESDSIKGLRNTDPMEPFPGGHMSAVDHPFGKERNARHFESFDLGHLKDDFQHAWYGDEGYDFLTNPSGGAKSKPRKDPDDPDPDEEYHPVRGQHDDRRLQYAKKYDDFFSTDSDSDEDDERMDKVVPHTDDDPYQQVDDNSPAPGLSDYGDHYEEKNAVEYGGDAFPKKSNFFSDMFGGEGGDGWDDPSPGKYDPDHDFSAGGHPERKDHDQQEARDPDDDLWDDSHWSKPDSLTHASSYEVAPSRDGFLVTSATGDVVSGPYARQDEAEHTARFAAYEEFLDRDPMAREAAWADVRQKALRLRREGAVKVTYYEPKEIQGEVQGDTGFYDAAVSRKNAFGNGVTYYSCSCPWGKWAYRRQFTYIGRFCSHGLALYHEMQALDNKGTRGFNEGMNPFLNPAGSTDLSNFTGWGHHARVATDVNSLAESLVNDMASNTRKQKIQQMSTDDLSAVEAALEQMESSAPTDTVFEKNHKRDIQQALWDVSMASPRTSRVAMDVDDDENQLPMPDDDPMTPPGAQSLMQNPSHAVEPDGQMEVFSEGDPLEGDEVPHVRDDGGDPDLMGEEVAHDPLGMGHPTETDDSGDADPDLAHAQIDHDMAALRGSNTGAPAEDDIALAARSFLARTAAKQYSLAEQEELMGERGSAHQLHSLNLENSLYSEGPHVVFLD